MSEEQKPNAEVVRLPLWREAHRKMLAEGIQHGTVYPAEFFEKELRCERDSMSFSLAIAELRRALEEDGYYISGRGQKGDSFVILPPEAHADVMINYGRKAADALRRGVILGTNTRLDLLSAGDRRRHESLLEKMAIKSALLARSGQIAKALPEAKRSLLSA